ncbi:MAG TPA: GGDEF domain-containing protein [Anaeromyxobacter sp.]|nr:GGDEF domain-containing protein [Anaeromyxobacter sp.]
MRAPLPAERPQGRPLLSPPGWVISALGMILCVGVADYVTGTEVSIILFYLAPIGFGTWFVSLRAGGFLAAAAAAVSIGADALHRLGTGEAGLPAALLAWNGIVQLVTSFALVLMLAALRSRLEAEELLARTDALTQISNRRAFFETAALEIERTRRTRRPLTLAYVDCDDFKDVNDARGHAEGDALLVEVARTIRATTRAIDAVARLGGDEFGLLLPETDAVDAAALLARLRTTLLAAMARNGWTVGFSIGAATFLAPPSSIDEMMARADALMYAAKREEKGSIRHGVFEGARGAAASP